MPRFGLQVLGYNVDLTLVRMLRNCAPFVDRIYYAWSAAPFSAYNSDARQLFPNPTPRGLVEQFSESDKLCVIEGEWPTEEACRNTCLDRAREDGMDYMIVQDADEFFLAEDYRRNLEVIAANPDTERFNTPWMVFWKSLDYVQEFRNPTFAHDPRLGTSPLFAVKISDPLRFTSQRSVNSSSPMRVLPGVCLHLAYVYSDQDLLRKLRTWSHANQFDGQTWFRRKWLAWQPSTRNLHPVSSVAVPRAVRYDGALPAELADFPRLEQQHVPLGIAERTVAWSNELVTGTRLFIRDVRARLKTTKSSSPK